VSELVVETSECRLETGGGVELHDLTDDVARSVSRAGITEGLAVVHVPGSTAAITTIEYEPGLVEDMETALEKLAPQNAHYAHNARWGDGNGHSHVRASLMGPSLSVPVTGGSLVLGTWQQVVLVELDNRPRSRRVVVKVMGSR
jgi:secondary thiamine-phosphate synthase enzyme